MRCSAVRCCAALLCGLVCCVEGGDEGAVAYVAAVLHARQFDLIDCFIGLGLGLFGAFCQRCDAQYAPAAALQCAIEQLGACVKNFDFFAVGGKLGNGLARARVGWVAVRGYDYAECYASVPLQVYVLQVLARKATNLDKNSL